MYSVAADQATPERFAQASVPAVASLPDFQASQIRPAGAAYRNTLIANILASAHRQLAHGLLTNNVNKTAKGSLRQVRTEDNMPKLSARVSGEMASPLLANMRDNAYGIAKRNAGLVCTYFHIQAGEL
jgi:hypothetical protein